jgi:hypothetical protein
LGFLVIWLIIYLLRRDVRKELVKISLLFTLAGFFNLIFIRDWWQPQTITNTIPSIEDFVFSFTTAGIPAVIYQVFFNKRLKLSKKFRKKERRIHFLKFMLLGFFSFLVAYFIFKINTFQSSMITALIMITIMWIKRKDLIGMSIISGILTLILFIPVYTFVDLVTPGWIDVFWVFKNVPRFIIFNMPIDDVFWWLLWGTALGPLYKFYRNAKLVDIK